MSYETHTEHFGDGGYTHTYMGLPFKIIASTPEEANEIAKAFSDHLDEILKDHPQVVGCTSMNDSIACFRVEALP